MQKFSQWGLEDEGVGREELGAGGVGGGWGVCVLVVRSSKCTISD